MTKTIYTPTCLRYFSDLCGVRCRGLCNKDHTGCSRGELSSTFSKCHSADIDRVMLDFISNESNDVETFGKGKPYSRMEKVATKYSFNEFMVALSLWRTHHLLLVSESYKDWSICSIPVTFISCHNYFWLWRGNSDCCQTWNIRPVLPQAWGLYINFIFLLFINHFRFVCLGQSQRWQFRMMMAVSRTTESHICSLLITSNFSFKILKYT